MFEARSGWDFPMELVVTDDMEDPEYLGRVELPLIAFPEAEEPKIRWFRIIKPKKVPHPTAFASIHSNRTHRKSYFRLSRYM